MRRSDRKVTLDEVVAYEIEVYGKLDADWSDWGCLSEIAVSDEVGTRVSLITGAFDQAALHGLLRRLYLNGFPLLSVRCVR